MTEPITPPADPNPAPPAGDPPATPPATPAPNPEFNRIAAENRIMAKKLADIEKAEADRAKAEMTELDRYKAEAAEAKTKAEKLEKENLISKSASKLGLPVDLWSRVQGSTAEEIEADVTALLGFIKPANQTPPPANTGNPPNTPPPAAGAEKTKLEAALADAQKSGNVVEMLNIKAQIAALK